ncbi:MAG: hypothetical protein ACLFTT_15365 [Candidatus Hydrogenedentota bacterium]
MSQHTLLIACALCLLLALAFGVLTGEASAQSADQDISSPEGMDALATKEFDEDKLPGKLEIGLAIGSIFVMIAVVKWL